MLQWKPDAVSGMVAVTPFARLEVFRMGTGRKYGYAAQIRGLDQQKVFASKIDLESGEAAKRWAELEYAKLLRKELDALGLLDALDFVD